MNAEHGPWHFTPRNQSYWLAHLCETNYQKLLRLLPDLHTLEGSTLANMPGKPPLHMELLEKSPHTLTLRLTHHFFGQNEEVLEIPAVQIRIYLDAEVAEALEDHARPSVFATFAHRGSAGEILSYKWRLNYFLSRWLDYCLNHLCLIP